ncbi:Man1-Src1p-C-terminal domain-containing protein [Annulohypoxylon truncatum]|uniref:Man1-Src1p-C-terminal domain-containing protein n=1 Tax=Annulohypoxylon truncatum TaxID=327061 RepID=UPI0020075FA8|nr:Man1-Src1p-C-terminal domain-containing protein [Annulohypoxylon truncatum]KAI1213845.1 Man1-Src1p-C-terminal domain-containing protein [Annulohypoxylon truncatum]
MSDLESLDYLQPGFDARTLTVPRIRSILVAHNVPYSSSAKKSQLVEIFNEQVLPQSQKILAARARAKRSSKGIVDAESQSSSNPFEEHEELAPRPVTRRSRSPRKASTRIKTEEPEDLPMPPRSASPTKRKSRASSRPVQASDTDTAPEHDGHRIMSKVRRPAPKIKKEDSEEGLFRRTSDVFTNDNPFQSGSSPSAVDRTPSVRRRTGGGDKPRSTSSGTRRRTEVHTAPAPVLAPKEERFSMPRSFGPPIVQKVPLKSVEPPMIEAGEEFTPEEQLQLSAEEAEHGDSSIAYTRQPRQPSGTGWGTILSVLSVTLLAIYGGWYRQEKIAVGYCGVGQAGSSIPNEIETPEWALSVLPPVITIPQSLIDSVTPECEPCPLHAYCYTDFSVRCEQDYILKPHPLALWGIVPLPPTCEPDGARVRRVQAVADKAIEELREQTAKYECGEPINEEGEKLETPAVEQQALKDIINKKRSKKMNNQEFEDLWGAALGEIKTREEVQVETTDSGGISNTYLTSTSLARISLTCALRRSVRLGVARYRLHISAVIAFILTAIYARYRYRAIRAAAAQVPALVDLVLERLANQKQLGDEDLDDPWLFLPNLRDDVLRSVHSLSEREKIWQRVRAVVEQNSNVRTGQREGRSGEMGRAWEWIGPTAGDPSSRRRRSNRASYGPDTSVDSPAGDGHHQKWEEPRPIY